MQNYGFSPFGHSSEDSNGLGLPNSQLDWQSRFSALMADALGEGTGALAGDVHEPGIAGDLVEHGQHALWFRQKAAVQIRFELQQGVVDAQTVVSHAPGNQIHVFLLTSQSLKNLQQLGRRRIQSVVEFCLMNFRARFPAKGFLAEIRDLAMHIEILSLEMFELRRQIEHLRAPCRAHLKWQ